MAAAVEHGGALARAVAEYGGEPADWIDLSTGINPNPAPLPDLPAKVWSRLPDEDLFERASDAAAAFYGAADGIRPLPVAGTQSVIQLLPFLFDGDVAIMGPTYEEYRARFQRAGRAVDIISGTDEISDRHRLVILVNPNNPDGRVMPRAAVLELADRLAVRGGHLVVDEAFADLYPEHSVAGFAGTRPNLIVFRSFGKFFGLAGLRLGFVLAAPAISSAMRDGQGPWAVSGPALELASLVLRDHALRIRIEGAIRQRHVALCAVLEEAGLKITGGTPLFVLVDDDRAQALHSHLCRHRILTRKFHYAPRWLRIGLCRNGDEESRLRAALAQYSEPV
ncbi:threonine-phosphate decarboxylase CobD [Nitratireductor sp. XY-223]|uniref:threonine-phosphate decarboxylase CobD n=1 Tax=Nitratireductor sp. XY-223 TaxID=2561926 RepID=UPI0010AA3CFB|nr:threonine-phosphate decarboxylase CobD [Nitratireductor sp. XY-223]